MQRIEKGKSLGILAARWQDPVKEWAGFNDLALHRYVVACQDILDNKNFFVLKPGKI